MTYEIEKEFKATINFPYIEDDRDSIIKGINLIAKGYRNQVFCTIAVPLANRIKSIASQLDYNDKYHWIQEGIE